MTEAELDRALERHARWNATETPDGQLSLTGVQLGAVDLSGRMLAGAQLYDVDLEGAKLIGTDFNRATVKGSNLAGADLTGADLYKADFEDLSLRGAVLRDVRAARGSFGGSDLSGADLTGADLSGCYLGNVDLTRARLDGADVYAAAISNAKLAGASLTKLSGLERPNVYSIDTGTGVLEGAEAVRWLQDAADPIDCIVYVSHPASDFEAWLERELLVRFVVERADERDPVRAREWPDGFLYFPHHVEAGPKRAVERLLPLLWDRGIPAVAACDYEHELPENGGYKSRSIPWPR
jgi:hypothetical protein